MSKSEFTAVEPIPRRGMTSIEAFQFLQQEHPAKKNWMCWSPAPGKPRDALMRLPVDEEANGKAGRWTWQRLDSKYPVLVYCDEEPFRYAPKKRWVGTIAATCADGARFLLFSYLSSRGTIGDAYMVSTHDRKLLAAFCHDLAARQEEDQAMAKISVLGEQDIYLDPSESRDVLLPAGIAEDIYGQVDCFFTAPDVYRGRGIAYRRGFLFVGPPGNGKTMMVREIVKQCWAKYRTNAVSLIAGKHTDMTMLEMVFGEATENGKGIVILEEIDTLAKETELTRAALLERLDGLSPADGVLVLATTNNPGEVDPALIHRPSRFDRVWHFEPPDEKLRRDYLGRLIEGVDGIVLDELVSGTAGWSFAYLNELRTTAAVLAVGNTNLQIPPDCVATAYRMLANQFQAGRRNHVVSEGSGSVGFGAV